jgi:hypothetical protein
MLLATPLAPDAAANADASGKVNVNVLRAFGVPLSVMSTDKGF